MELCRHLRWKGFDESQTAAEVRATALRNTVPYRCLRTCQPFGVDDDLAAPENCIRGRACFTPRAPEPR